ncbi:MAG: leucyl-tRNA synthetase [Pseudonocardiales bacterium]|jgi:leucyl-tRNA synthetase|nr:leucyl-tRNA synthetase [Pseudonocardiales bacterium]
MATTDTPREFDPHAIDAYWTQVWDKEQSWVVDNNADAANSVYVLEMLPYTSGEPHVGHLKNYAVGDAIAHFMRRHDKRVLHPMGFDAFGLPAENHAIRTGKHPRVSTDESIASFREQFKQWGISIDWTREISTHEPSYYRWTQWIFLQLYKAGLAYRKRSAVNWCPKDATVLANEQVVDGRCERCGTLVESKNLEQWFFKITDYADRLLADLDGLEWPAHVKTMQRNWIGRSEGASVIFHCAEVDFDIEVFTTRPDTLFGVTFLAISPEHPELHRLIAGTPAQPAIQEYANQARRESHAERGGDRVKTGILTGRHAVHPLSGAKVPIVVADYVLMEYGTGAVMGVPAHDERDYAAAQTLGFDIRQVIGSAAGSADELPFTAKGVTTNSGEFDGLESAQASRRIVAALVERGAGEASISYRLRDWLLSRQRYWGCPIPMLYCESCGLVPVPEDQLPVLLPDVEDYAPKGKSPLATAVDWVQTRCPQCAGPAKRETDTMDTFVDSSWYYLRYCDPHNTRVPWSEQAVTTWMPVDQYIGGIEHAILHLLYSRFLCKALSDLGHLSTQEPFQRLFTQGMITRDGAKMSKSKGNVVSPRTLIDQYGVDAVRCYVLFMGPPEAGGDWSDEGVEGVYRFLRRLWRVAADVAGSHDAVLGTALDQAREDELRREMHATIKKVTEDMSGGSFAFNTAIAALMKLNNSCILAAQNGIRRETLREAVRTIASLLLPFAPHVASEVYHQLTGDHVWKQPWPVADEAWLHLDTVELALQINAKNRGKLVVAADAPEDAIKQAALDSDIVRAAQNGSTIRKVIVVPGRLVNVVVK